MPTKRKSTRLRLLDGTHREDRHGKRLDTSPIVGTPTRPKLTKDEATVWDAVIKQWEGTEVVGAIDTAELTACCEMWGLYRQAVALAKETPTDKEVRCAVTGYLAMFDKLAAKYGMTQHDRAALEGCKTEAKDETEAMYG